MNKTEFKREVKRINTDAVKSKNPELAKNLEEMQQLASKPDSGIFDAETEAILDIVFDSLKKNPEYLKGKTKVTVDKPAMLKKQGLQLVKQRRDLRKKTEAGDKAAAKKLLALVKQRRQWQKEISGKFKEGGNINVSGFNLVYETWSKTMGGNGISGTIRTVPENYYVATIDEKGKISFNDTESMTKNINKKKVKNYMKAEKSRKQKRCLNTAET